jgi:hypothetical protein
MWPFDPNKQQMYQMYAQAHNTGDYSSIDPFEAQGQLQQFVQNAPPDEQQQVFQQHFSQMSPDQRAQLAQQFPPEYGVNPNDPAVLELLQSVAFLCSRCSYSSGFSSVMSG